jgi:hypothetical protein
VPYEASAPAPHGRGDYKKTMDRLLAGKDAPEEERTTLLMQVSQYAKSRLRSLCLSQVIGSANGTTECNGTVVKLPGLPEMYDYGEISRSTF